MNIEYLNEFIENQLTIAPPNFTIVYIYAYKRFVNNEALSISLLASNLIGFVEQDIINALNFWKEKDLLFFDGQTIDFNFEEQTSTVDKNDAVEINSNRNILIDSKPVYSPEELEFYRNASPDIDRLFSLAKSAFGNLISSNDLSTLFSFYDWLRLPIDVIQILVVYSVENGNGNIRYMEKVALDWHEKGLNTSEKVNDYLRKTNKDYRSIFKALGISRDLTDIDIELFKKWENTYGFSMDLILEACDKAIGNAPNPTLKYVNGILENWHKEGAKTIEAVEVLENKYYEAEAEKNKTGNHNKKPTNTKFNNFSQDQIDFNDITSRERNRLKSLYDER